MTVDVDVASVVIAPVQDEPLVTLTDADEPLARLTVDIDVEFVAIAPVHDDPLARLTVDVDVELVEIAPVKVDAAPAFRVTTLPLVAFSSLLVPAFAVTPLKLTLATDGSAKIRSPVLLVIVTLSKVAVWFVPPRNAIARPAEAIVPPPVATIEAPSPLRPIAVAAVLVVMTLRGPDTAIEPALPLLAKSLAKSPVAPAPEVVTVVDASVIFDPAPSALTP